MRKLIGTAVILAALFLGLGFYLDWFNLSSQQKDSDHKKTTITLEVDKEKMHEDTEAARQKAGDFGDKVKTKIDSLGGTETVKGSVIKVNEGDHLFTLMTASNKELTFEIDASSQVRLNDREASMNDLKAGHHVTVTYKVKDGKNMARSIAIEPKS
jgi:hypothetical protein